MTSYTVTTHYCTNCARTRPKVGGRDKVSANGRTRRWVCAECVEKRGKSWFGKGAK